MRFDSPAVLLSHGETYGHSPTQGRSQDSITVVPSSGHIFQLSLDRFRSDFLILSFQSVINHTQHVWLAFPRCTKITIKDIRHKGGSGFICG